MRRRPAKERYERRCRKHHTDILSYWSGEDGESLRCTLGHSIRVWLIVDTRFNRAIGAASVWDGGVLESDRPEIGEGRQWPPALSP